MVTCQATRVGIKALAVPALKLQHHPRVCVEGGDGRRHAAGEGDAGRARDKHKEGIVKSLTLQKHKCHLFCHRPGTVFRGT